MRLRKMCDGPKWDRVLGGALFAINTRRSRRHRTSPAELLYGVTPRGPLEINVLAECDVEESSTPIEDCNGNDHMARLAKLEQLRQENASQRQEAARPWTKVKPVNLNPGDPVLYWVENRFNKLAPRWAGPAVVKWVGAKGAVGVKLPGRGRTKVFAGHHVKLCTADPTTGAPAARGRGMKRSAEASDRIQPDQLENKGRLQIRRTKR